MVKSQGIQISEKYLQPTRLVLTESFTSIGVLPGIRQQPDMSNLITYLAVLSDASGMKGQLLFQLNPEGNISYWAVSNSIQSRMKCGEMKQKRFEQCVQVALSDPFIFQPSEACIECLLQKMNDCL